MTYVFFQHHRLQSSGWTANQLMTVHIYTPQSPLKPKLVFPLSLSVIGQDDNGENCDKYLGG